MASGSKHCSLITSTSGTNTLGQLPAVDLLRHPIRHVYPRFAMQLTDTC